MIKRRTLGRKPAVPKSAPQPGVAAAALATGGTVPIVGIGASAGGLEAFLELLKHLPTNTGFGFVLVQHLDPQHESALASLLSRATSMPVQEITDRLRVEPDHVYVIPPNSTLRVDEGMLRLEPREARIPVRSIDRFLESLAADRGERAIGVILSGTASDGTVGLEAIKAEGGITFAQDHSAKYDSMPRSAIAAGCVDFVLSLQGIAQELERISRHPYVAGSDADPRPAPVEGNGTSVVAPPGEGDTALRKILIMLRQHSGVDFSLYKAATIERRMARRVLLTRQDSLEEYAESLRGNPAELSALHNDLLISVTSFFRNPDVFEMLKTKVFPTLLARQTDDPIRVWVLGCSTGQEAYSIAMVYEEAAAQTGHTRRLQIFATDLNESLLARARHGLYSPGEVEGVSPERLRRFFQEDSGGFRITKPLRESVVFARQNVVSDPPFSRLDLISCRNLLIYLEPALQRRVFPNFHYALRPGGFLLLGASEAVSGYTDLFEPVDAKRRLFVRQGGTTPSPRAQAQPVAEAAPAAKRRVRAFDRAEDPLGPPSPDALREADRVTLGHYSPPGVLVDDQLQVIHFRGAAGEYLDLPAGKASFDLLKMAREGLLHPLRLLIDKARKEKKQVRRDGVQYRRRGKLRSLTLHVIPLRNLKERAFLVLFEEDRKAATPGRLRTRDGQQAAKLTTALERELTEAQHYLQSVQDQHEVAVEELQASNEEVQSANEELQSINEELETSKEELESANEELVTINEEMGHRNAELGRLNSDLVNLQNATHLTVILVARDLTIRRFSPEAARHLRLTSADVGRPIGGVRHNLMFVPRSGVASSRSGLHRRADDLGPGPTDSSPPVSAEADGAPDLESILTDVIDKAREREREVRDRSGRWYLLRARPYLTADDKVDGAVLVLLDITELKRTEQRAQAARDYAEAMIRTAHDPVLVLRENLVVNTANDAFYRTFGESPEVTEGRSVFELGDGAWNIPRLKMLLEEVLPQNTFFNDFEVTHVFPGLGRRTMVLNGRRLRLDDGSSGMVLLAFHDVTDRDSASLAIRQGQTRYEGLVRATAQIVWATDAQGQVVADSPSWREFTGQSHEEQKGQGWLEAIHRDDRERVRAAWQTAVAGRIPFEAEYRLRFRGGGFRWTTVRAVPVEGPDGVVQEWIGMNTDITERKHDEEALLLADQRKNEFLAILAHELRNPLAPIRNMLEVMKRADGDAGRIESALETMDRQVGQMTRLIDDLFDISRISRGKIELRRGVVELGALVRQSAEAGRPLTERFRHQLVVNVPPEPMHVYGDAGRLSQAVDNLLNNACKFTAPGGRITLTLERSRGHALIRVRDTGIGIDPRVQGKVFELFMQVDSSLERAVGGLGIGLTLVKNLVEMHGGTVEVSSQPGEGSEFTLRFPLLAGITESSEVRPDEAAPTRSRRILVVDDNRDSTDSLALLLGSAGHKVAKAFDGEMGLEKCAEFRPEVILLDLGLPKMNGYEAAKRIRAEEWCKDVVLIAVTGWGQEEDRKRTAAAGFDHHLVKPLDFDVLTRLLNESV